MTVAKDGCRCDVCLYARAAETRAQEHDRHASSIRKAAWERVKAEHPEVVPVPVGATDGR